MNHPRQFGPYLLLKTLAEDALGETFRAARGMEAVEQILLLRVFNGASLDLRELRAQVEDRADLQAALRSPYIGDGVDFGVVDQIPFVAYDYISGLALSTLREQAALRSQPMPPELAALMVERIALALAAASHARFSEEPVRHGFVVPPLVMLSNEGEVRLLGFEVAPGLRSAAVDGSLHQEFSRYLSPEALSGAPLSKSDDVYSLGILLIELLLGESVPSRAGDQLGPRIETVSRQLSPAFGQLIARSVARSHERIADATSWHRELTPILAEAGHQATPFHLALFLHHLLSKEIEQEVREVATERTLQLPVAEPEPTAPAASPTEMVEGLAAMAGTNREPAWETAADALASRDLQELLVTSPTVEPSPPSDPSGSFRAVAVTAAGPKRHTPILLAVLIVLLGGAAGAYIYLNRSMGAPSPLTSVALAAQSATAPVSTARVSQLMDPSAQLSPSSADGAHEAKVSDEGAQAGDSRLLSDPTEATAFTPSIGQLDAERLEDRPPDVVQERVDRLVAQREASLERSLRAEYSEKIRSLQRQLDDARETPRRTTSTETPPRPSAEEAEPSSARPPVNRTPKIRTPRTRTSSTEARADQPRLPAPVGPQAAQSAASPSLKPGSEAAITDAPPSRNDTETGGRATNSTGNSMVRNSTVPVPARRVRLGDLMTAGPGVEPPRLIERLEPVYPAIARRLKKEARIEVRMLIDENGSVERAKLLRNDPGYGFAASALKAARRARLEPARADGVRVKMWMTVAVDFRLDF